MIVRLAATRVPRQILSRRRQLVVAAQRAHRARELYHQPVASVPMSTYRTKTWPSVVAFYQKSAPNSARIAHMAELVARVATSPYAAALHPVTSHYMLRLFAHDSWEPGDDQIQIEHDGEAFEVRYVASARPHKTHQAPVR